ncbi:MAG: LEA type 2 family protein [Thermodesulfobacteriota bacterium]
MNLKIFSFLTALFLLILGLSALCPCLQAFTTPEVDLQDVNIVGMDRETLDLEGVLKIRNPNDLGAKFSGYQFQLEVEGQRLSQGESNRPFQIPASGAVTLAIPATVLWDDLLAVGRKGILGRDLVYVLKGTAFLDSILGKIPVPFSHQDTFNLADLLREKTRRFFQGL